MTTEIRNTEDLIDSRDVIARIEDLESQRAELVETFETANETWHAKTGDNHANFVAVTAARETLAAWDAMDEAEELKTLQALAAEAEDYAADWTHGETLIRDSYFRTYAEELAEDIGAVNSEATWPNNCIDWERAARELRMDYTEVSFGGVAYLVR